jgi:hypothetical protein
LVLDPGVLPRAPQRRSAAAIRAIEESFEPLGHTASLAIQVLTGLWMVWITMQGFQGLLKPGNPVGMLVSVEAAAGHHNGPGRSPNLTDATLNGLEWHSCGITAISEAGVPASPG